MSRTSPEDTGPPELAGYRFIRHIGAGGWAAVRQQRGAGKRTTIGRQRPWQRIGLAAGVLAVAGVGATFVGPHLSGTGAHQRVVLSVVPPFDVAPTRPRSPGSVITPRMCRQPSASTARFSGFQRVGTLLPGAVGGHAETAAITIEAAYDQQPWLPDLAGTTGFVSFGPAGQGAAAQVALRFNVATATGIIPGGVPAGLGRLDTLLESKQIVGDDEQYAATMALLANAVGVPARVSLDGTVEANGAIYGKDVRADVELDTAQYGWVRLPADQFTGTENPTKQGNEVAPPPQSVKVVPPGQNAAAPVPGGNSSDAVSHPTSKPPARHAAGFVIPAIVVALLKFAGIPLLAVLAVVTALIAAKAVRRRRRRTLGPPAARAVGAWRELLDLGRDLGIGSAEAAATRREQAALAEAGGLPSAGSVAAAADAAVCGPAEPDDAAAARVWALADEARRSAMTRLSRRRRAWVAVNPAGLFPFGID